MYTLTAVDAGGATRISVYDESGRRLVDEAVDAERIIVRGALSVEYIRGFERIGLVAFFARRPCIHRRGSQVEVSPCGAGGREEQE